MSLPRWHWRNCRRLSIIFHFRVWPFLSAGADRNDDVFGGDRWIWFGPLAIGLQYDHGNCSAESWRQSAFALSEAECFARACHFEGIAESGADS